jgi:hypothetical protein
LFCEPVSSLSAQITLIGAFDQDLDAGIGLDRLHLAQDTVPVVLTLVGLLVAPVGSPVSEIGLPVTPIRLPVTPIGLPVAPIGLPVTSVRCHVALSGGVALVRGVVALSGRLVARLRGTLALSRRLVAPVRTLPTSLRRNLAVQHRLGLFDQIIRVLVCERLPEPLGPFRGNPVPLVGKVGALVSVSVPLVGDAVTLVGDPVTLVGAALALLGLGSHRASLQ